MTFVLCVIKFNYSPGYSYITIIHRLFKSNCKWEA